MIKNVLIVGGSGGIGSTVALQAAATSWDVIVGYRTGQERANALTQRIVNAQGKIWTTKLALDDKNEIDRGLDNVASKIKNLNAVVLSASPPPQPASFLKTTADELTEQLTVNVVQTHYLLVQIWKRFFRPNGGGHIVTILSAASIGRPWKHLTAYVAAKRALQTLVECALVELASSGLRATFIYPSYTETPMLTNQDRLIVAAARARTVTGKFLSPKEVADVVVNALNNPPTGEDPTILSIGEAGQE